jgi:hypothetical protein
MSQGVPMTEAVIGLLTQLLRRAKEQLPATGEDGFDWPTDELMKVAHGVVSYWAPELVIWGFRPGDLQPQILLAQYDGNADWFKNLWHIPGGYNRFNEPDIQAVCSRLAMRELGVDVIAKRTLGEYKWREGEHPYGRPLSIYKECRPVGGITERDNLRFFPCNELPSKIVVPHLNFIREYFS